MKQNSHYILACGLMAFIHSRATAEIREFTLDEIRDTVVSSRAALHGLEVDFQMTATAGPSTLVTESSQQVMTNFHAVVIESKYKIGFAPTQSREFTRISARDGLQWTNYADNNRLAIISADTTAPTTDLKGIGFFDLNLLHGQDIGDIADDQQSLINILQSSLAHLRPELDECNGTPCYVVDVADPRDATGHTQLISVWLDPTRNFLPVRHRYGTSGGDDRGYMEFQVLESVKVGTNLWLAVSGTKQVFASGDPQLGNGIDYVIEVNQNDNGQLDLQTHFDDFAIDTSAEAILPPGSFVSDSRTGKTRQIACADFGRFADDAIRVAKAQNLDYGGAAVNTKLASEDSSDQYSSRFGGLWFVVMGLSAALSVGYLAVENTRRCNA